MNRQSAQKIFGGDVKSHMLMFLSKKAETYDDLIALYKKAAPAFKGKVCCFSSFDRVLSKATRFLIYLNLG